MSTKIYDAFIMVDDVSLFELKHRMQKLRDETHKIIQQEAHKLIASDCAELVDLKAMGCKVYASPFSYSRTIISSAVNTAEERYRKIKKTLRRDPEYDFSFEICIIPIKGKILLLPYTEKKELLNLLERQKYLKPYGYWNNTDPDKSVSQKEWNQREKDWNAALPGIGIPADNGFTVQLHPTFNIFRTSESFIKDIIKVMPSYRKRLKTRAFDIAWGRMTRRLVKAEKKKKDGRDDLNCCMEARSRIKNTQEGKALLKQATIFVRSKIPKRITQKHLKLKLQEQKKETPNERDSD